MLDKALQQPEGKINEKVLYTEEEVELLCYQAFLDGMSYESSSTTDVYQTLDQNVPIGWLAKHKKH